MMCSQCTQSRLEFSEFVTLPPFQTMAAAADTKETSEQPKVAQDGTVVLDDDEKKYDRQMRYGLRCLSYDVCIGLIGG